MTTDTVRQRHRPTDGQTACRGITALCVASRGKKWDQLIGVNPLILTGIRLASVVLRFLS